MPKNAIKYYQNAVYHLEKVRNFYKGFLGKMNIPKNVPLKVIDIGAGSGRVSNEVLLPLLPKNVSEIVLSDMDDEMIKFTSSITKDPRVKFEKLNIVDENIPKHLEKRFDLLFSSYCFSYLKNLRQGFRNCGKLMKPDGELLTIFQYQKNALYTMYRRMSGMEKWKKYTEDFSTYTTHLRGPNPQKELKNIFNDIGMNIVDYKFHPELNLDLTKNEALEVYKSLDEKFFQIPKHLKEDYRKDFLRILSEETEIDFSGDNLDTIIEFNFPTVIVHAKN